MSTDTYYIIFSFPILSRCKILWGTTSCRLRYIALYVIVSKRIQSPIEHYKMNLFLKIVKGWKSLTIFTKSSILDVWLGSPYPSVVNSTLSFKTIDVIKISYEELARFGLKKCTDICIGRAWQYINYFWDCACFFTCIRGFNDP